MRVFISYRREDSAHLTDRIYDRLSRSFGPDSVFKDVANIPLGADFRQLIRDTIVTCTTLIAVIGKLWGSLAGASGRPRLFDPDDMVCFEIATALNEHKTVIPVLTAGSSIPTPGELPTPLNQLSGRNGIVVRPDPDFHRDMDRVVAALAGGDGMPEPAKPWFRLRKTDRDQLRELDRCCRGWYDSLVKTRARIVAADSDARAAELAYEYVNTRKYLPRIVAIRDAFAERKELADLVAAINAFLDLLTTQRQEQKVRAEWSGQLDSVLGQRRSGPPGKRDPRLCQPHWVTGLPRGGWSLVQDEALEPLQASLDDLTGLVASRLSEA